MDAVEFLRTAYRMCNTYSDCDSCPASGNSCFVNPIDRRRNPDGVVAAVENWSKDHPIKTRQSKFLKMFPEVPMKDDVIDICPATVVEGLKNAEHCNHILCEDCKKTFWLIEVSE